MNCQHLSMRYLVTLWKEVAKISSTAPFSIHNLTNCHSCSFRPNLIKCVVAWDNRNKVIPKDGIKTSIASKASLMLCLKDSTSLCLSNFVEINSHWQHTRNMQKWSSHQERMLANIKKQPNRKWGIQSHLTSQGIQMGWKMMPTCPYLM